MLARSGARGRATERIGHRALFVPRALRRRISTSVLPTLEKRDRSLRGSACGGRGGRCCYKREIFRDSSGPRRRRTCRRVRNGFSAPGQRLARTLSVVAERCWQLGYDVRAGKQTAASALRRCPGHDVDFGSAENGADVGVCLDTGHAHLAGGFVERRAQSSATIR